MSEADHRREIKAALAALNAATEKAFKDNIDVELDLVAEYVPGRAQPHVTVKLLWTAPLSLKRSVKEAISNRKSPQTPDMTGSE